MTTRPFRPLLTHLTAVLLLIPLAGCPWLPGTPATPDNIGDPTLRAFADEQAARRYFRDELARQQRTSNSVGTTGFGGVFFGATPTAAPEGGDDAAGAGGGSAFTGTNLQEAGVDESDVFKSDGTYFYVASGNLLRIVQATPITGLSEIGRFDLGHRIHDLYLAGDTVITLGSTYADSGDDVEILIWPPYYRAASTIVTQLDVSVRTAPTQTQQVEIDGALATSRLTDGRLIAVTTIVPDLPSTLDDAGPLRPEIRGASAGAAAPLIDWTEWYHPADADGLFTTAVTSLDAAAVESVIGALAVVAEAGTIYMSPNALYLTDDRYDAAQVARPTTAIHKITFPAGVPTYAASGNVPGRLLNQFSLSEADGYLRLATHVQNADLFPPFGRPEFVDVLRGDADTTAVTPRDVSQPDNAVYVLSEVAGELVVAGAIEGIAPGEQLYAVRFLGDHGFLVTFLRIDPLFVLDLTDPTNPLIAGELKIPGFSEYLHPFGDDRLIGIGQATSESQWGATVPDGIQLSLFDVSDWSNPQVIQQITVGGPGSYADTAATHKAFAFLPEQRLLAIPAELNISDGAQGTFGWQQGVLCYEVDPAAGFIDKGLLPAIASTGDGWGWQWGYDTWRRAAFIGDTLYALTAAGVRGAPVSDLTDATALTFGD